MRRLYIYLVALTAQLVFGFQVYVRFPAYRHLFVKEDQLVQNVTVLFYLISVVVAVRSFTRYEKSNTQRRRLLIPALIGVTGFLDEIGWGERLFHLSMPVTAGNHKINAVHDLIDVVVEAYGRQYTVVRASLFLDCVVGLMLVCFPYRERIFRVVSLIPRQPLYYAWALFAVIGAIAVFLDQKYTVLGNATFFEEVLEMNAAFVLILATLETHKALLNTQSGAIETPKANAA